MNLKTLFGTPKVDPIQQLADELRDQNRLLRALLGAQGVALPSRQITPATPPKKRTARDVTVQTREDIWEQQQKDAGEAGRRQMSPSDSTTKAETLPDPTASKN